jgi:tetratricopeptide (TPR) repeat protein
MAGKNKTLARASAGFGAKSLTPELNKAKALMIKKKWADARLVLDNLSRSYGHNSEIFAYLANVCYELKDLPGYERACEILAKQEPNNADYAYSLAGSRYVNLRPILALLCFQDAVSRFPNHERASYARETIAELDSSMDELLATMNLTRSNGWDIAILHEQAQSYLAQGEYHKAQQTEKELLQLRPDFISSYNNLSLISFMLGDSEEAIAISQKALEIQPDNIHTLANLTRYYFLNGDINSSQITCEKLKNSQAPGWDMWAKKAETLSYFGLDEEIIELFEQAKAEGELQAASVTGFFPHFVAVALTRQERIDEARKLWREAASSTQASEIAQANLDDLKQPIGKRHAPWALPLSSWITKNTLGELVRLVNSNSKLKDEQQIASSTRRYFDEHPQTTNLVPILLKLGDPQGREFAFRLASFAKTPEMLAVLQDFAQSQQGPDSMRYEAAIQVSSAGILPDSAMSMWIQGKWQQDINLFCYELHHEPTTTHSPKVNQMAAQAVSLMKTQKVENAVQAEKILKKALDIEPDSVDLLNNLAGVYQIQGRTEEVYQLLSEILEKYPNYTFSRVSLARLKIAECKVEEAEALLKPLMTRKRFHFLEFGNFCNAQIELFIAKKQKDKANAWLKMWENLDPSNPELMRWKIILSGENVLKKLSKMSGWGL